MPRPPAACRVCTLRRMRINKCAPEPLVWQRNGFGHVSSRSLTKQKGIVISGEIGKAVEATVKEVPKPRAQDHRKWAINLRVSTQMCLWCLVLFVFLPPERNSPGLVFTRSVSHELLSLASPLVLANPLPSSHRVRKCTVRTTVSSWALCCCPFLSTPFTTKSQAVGSSFFTSGIRTLLPAGHSHTDPLLRVHGVSCITPSHQET